MQQTREVSIDEFNDKILAHHESVLDGFCAADIGELLETGSITYAMEGTDEVFEIALQIVKEEKSPISQERLIEGLCKDLADAIYKYAGTLKLAEVIGCIELTKMGVIREQTNGSL